LAGFRGRASLVGELVAGAKNIRRYIEQKKNTNNTEVFSPSLF
jgi:hypothetical protein